MEVKQGNKKTELGVIPEDWAVVHIGALEPYITSGSRGWASYYCENGSPFIRITNLVRDNIYLDLDDLRYVQLPANNCEATRTRLEVGDILISITADIGIVGLVTGRVPSPAYINQHIALVRLEATKADPRFVSYYLAAESTQRLFRAFTDSGAKSGMSLITVGKILVALPPTLAEQEAIAEALSDADALIESLEQLLVKKRHIKQGAMQELLTGKKRLPGFETRKGYKQTEVGVIPEDWEVLKLAKFAPLQRGFDLPASARTDGPFPVVCSNGIEGHHAQAMVHGPGVVTGRSGTLGRVHYIDQDYWPHNTTLWVTRFYGSCPRFVFYLYSWIGFARFTSGSGVPTLNRNDAHAFEVGVPSKQTEQEAIATILSDIDEELTALETKLNKARQIKQGMMQELLTGRIRLV